MKSERPKQSNDTNRMPDTEINRHEIIQSAISVLYLYWLYSDSTTFLPRKSYKMFFLGFFRVIHELFVAFIHKSGRQGIWAPTRKPEIT